MDESWDASELKRAYSEQVVESQATEHLAGVCNGLRTGQGMGK
jgi:hypothetical protein